MSCGRIEMQTRPGAPPTPASANPVGDEAAVGLDRALDQVGGAEEGRDEAVGRPVVELDRRADLLDAALVEHRDAVGDRVGVLLVVGDVDRGDAELALQLPQLRRASRPAAGRRGSTAARRAAAPPARSRWCARARRAAAGRRTVAPAAGRRTARARPGPARRRPCARSRRATSLRRSSPKATFLRTLMCGHSA